MEKEPSQILSFSLLHHGCRASYLAFCDHPVMHVDRAEGNIAVPMWKFDGVCGLAAVS